MDPYIVRKVIPTKNVLDTVPLSILDLVLWVLKYMAQIPKMPFRWLSFATTNPETNQILQPSLLSRPAS